MSKRWIVLSREFLAIVLSCAVLIVTYLTAQQSQLGQITPVIQIGKSINAVSISYEQLAKLLYQAPIDATFGRYTKVIPALNGVSLNVSQTIANQTGNPATTKLYFSQIPPRIPTSAFTGRPFLQGNAAKHQVALMINVAWGEQYIQKILSILTKNHVQATFFLDGKWAQNHPQWVIAINKAGMEIGSHAYGHPAMTRLSRQQKIETLTKTNQIIEKIIAKPITLFAPPSGDYDQQTVDIAAGLGMKTILWSVDTIDWRLPTPQKIIERVNRKIAPGSLVLMHPTQPTLLALPSILRELKARDLLPVTVSKILSPIRPVISTLQEALIKQKLAPSLVE
nr:polysaccharide deacetylase family protein [Bacilli bacterium]